MDSIADRDESMRRIAVLGDTLVSGSTFGIQRFAYELLRELDELHPEAEVVIVVPEYAQIQVSFQNIQIVRYGKAKSPFLWRQLCFTDYVKKHRCVGVDLTLGLPILGCSVVALYDCTYENYSADFITLKEKIRRISYLLKAKRLVRTAGHILTVSENSKKDLMDYYGIPADKISVIYCAWQHYEKVEADEHVFDKIGLDQNAPYFFSLGSGLKHKNLQWMVQAALQNPQYMFVLTGSDQFSSYLQQLGLEKVDNLIYTGYLEDGEVKALMERCAAFVQPAFCEGFGIPPLEALSVGAEIIVSESGSLPEVYGDSARYIDPYSYHIDMDQILAQKIDASDKDDVLSKYSWQKSAERFWRILQKAAC